MHSVKVRLSIHYTLTLTSVVPTTFTRRSDSERPRMPSFTVGGKGDIKNSDRDNSEERPTTLVLRSQNDGGGRGGFTGVGARIRH